MTEIDPSILKLGGGFMRGPLHWVLWVRDSQTPSQSIQRTLLLAHARNNVQHLNELIS
jgi:hypothetical protein